MRVHDIMRALVYQADFISGHLVVGVAGPEYLLQTGQPLPPMEKLPQEESCSIHVRTRAPSRSAHS